MSGRKNQRPNAIDHAKETEEAKVELDAFLKSRGLKLTSQRMAIFEEVFRDHGHFYADEIAARLKKRGGTASRATVYRTLDLLVEAELVKAVRPGTSQMYFEHVNTGEHHDHLVCVECSEIFEFYSADIEDAQCRVCKDLGFIPHKHTMVIYGICRKCQGKKG